jgi:hypothetical protein
MGQTHRRPIETANAVVYPDHGCQNEASANSSDAHPEIEMFVIQA